MQHDLKKPSYTILCKTRTSRKETLISTSPSSSDVTLQETNVVAMNDLVLKVFL
jgi:hypothetical protein